MVLDRVFDLMIGWGQLVSEFIDWGEMESEKCLLDVVCKEILYGSDKMINHDDSEMT